MAAKNNPTDTDIFLQASSQESIKKIYIELIKELNIIKSESRRDERLWSFIYLALGGCAVLFSSTSAIITFLDLSKQNSILFSITLLSTASAFLLTFLDPSSRASKRKSTYNKSSSILIKACTNQHKVAIIPFSDALKEMEFLVAETASLHEDSYQKEH